MHPHELAASGEQQAQSVLGHSFVRGGRHIAHSDAMLSAGVEIDAVATDGHQGDQLRAGMRGGPGIDGGAVDGRARADYDVGGGDAREGFFGGAGQVSAGC